MQVQSFLTLKIIINIQKKEKTKSTCYLKFEDVKNIEKLAVFDRKHKR